MRIYEHATYEDNSRSTEEARYEELNEIQRVNVQACEIKEEYEPSNQNQVLGRDLSKCWWLERLNLKPIHKRIRDVQASH